MESVGGLFMANARVYANDVDGLWLSRPVQLEHARGMAVGRVRPGELVGLPWAELRRLPVGAELEVEVPEIDWRSMTAAPPRVVRVVHATEPSGGQARPVEAPPAPQSSAESRPEPPPEPSAGELAAEGERAAVAMMQTYLRSRGLIR